MKKELIVQRDPKSPISEIFRTLRTNIQFMTSNRNLKTLVVTSTVPGEGKSWVTANLAVTFAQAGKKVILVDSDMRKGRQYSIFSVPPKPGLSNYLSGIDDDGDKSNIKKYIRETEVDNLFIIPSGSIPPNPSELLVSEKCVEMIEELKKISDIIIFDGTPSLLVTDAIILSRFVDSTIIVTSHKDTKMENLNKVKKAIINVGGRIAGVVLNRVPITAKKYEDAYYYGGRTDRLKNQTIEKRKTNLVSSDSKSKEIENISNFEVTPEDEKTKDLLDKLNIYLNDKK